MRRSSSNNLFSHDVDPVEYNARLIASFEDEIKSKLDDGCSVNIALDHDTSSLPVFTITLQSRMFKNTYKYEFLKHKSLERLIKAFCCDLLCDFLARDYPNLKIQSINSLQIKIRYYSSNMYTTNSPVSLSECIDFSTGKFDAKKFMEGTKIEAKGVPDVIDLPLLLSPQQIERGIDVKNVLYSDLNPGMNYAVFVSGEDPYLGGWKEAKRMSFVRDRWRLTLPEGVTKAEYKFLVGHYTQGKNVSVDTLRWDSGSNRQIPLGSTTPRFGH